MFNMWHGGRRWQEAPQVFPPKRGKYECGPGIYLTNKYDRAQKYAKGGGVTQLVRVAPVSEIRWLERETIELEEMSRYIERCYGLSKKKEIITDLVASADRLNRTDLTASYIVNLCVNYEVLAGKQGVNMAFWLTDQGIDASLYTLGNQEQWVVVFNPKIIRHFAPIPAKDVSIEMRELPLIALPAKSEGL